MLFLTGNVVGNLREMTRTYRHHTVTGLPAEEFVWGELVGDQVRRRTFKMLQEIGFWGAVTTHGGRTHGLADAYLWTRVRIAGQYSLQDVANLLGEKYP